MPLTWAQAIVDAYMLFLKVQFASLGNEETRHLLRFTQQHFAEPGLLDVWTQTYPGYSIRHWLLPEP